MEVSLGDESAPIQQELTESRERRLSPKVHRGLGMGAQSTKLTKHLETGSKIAGTLTAAAALPQ